MDAPPAAAQPKPCCVCGDEGGKHCTLCKSRHYCSKKCQVVDWKEGGHKEACKQMAKEFQDRLLDELMPLKKVKEEPPIVADVAPAAGSKARLPAARTTSTALVKATAPNDGAPDWRGTCAICFDELPLGAATTFYSCCSKKICKECSDKCLQHDNRCPLCRTPASTSAAERLRRLQKHVDKGDAEAQNMLGDSYHEGQIGLKKSAKRAFQLYQLAAAQGYAPAQTSLGICFEHGHGAKIDYKSAAQWYRRAAEQGHPQAQFNLGLSFFNGKGVTRSFDEAVRWWRLAAAQGDGDALYYLGGCYKTGCGVSQDLHEAMRFYARAAAQGISGAAAEVDKLKAYLAATRHS
jgi:TPR repeat protein